MTDQLFFNRKHAVEYLQNKYGFGNYKTLAKLACIGGGPEFRKVGSRAVVYEKIALDEWALSKIGPRRRKASEDSFTLEAVGK